MFIDVNFLQCQEEGWAQMLKEQEKEGCNVFGYLEVNKVIVVYAIMTF